MFWSPNICISQIHNLYRYSVSVEKITVGKKEVTNQKVVPKEVCPKGKGLRPIKKHQKNIGILSISCDLCLQNAER